MKIFLKILGSRLFEQVAKEVAALDSAFPRRLGHAKMLSWHLEKLETPMRGEYLYQTSDQVSVLLIEVQNRSDIDILWDVGGREYRGASSRQDPASEATPVILVFNEPPESYGVLDMPMMVDDWVCDLEAMHELSRRVIASLRRQEGLQEELGVGQLTLNSETRRLAFGGDSVQLSPAEAPLAELFMSHIGSVIPIDEILLMFNLTGRSTTSSNIRVTIFQLRFKIELLTRHHFTLACAYGEGYALRPGKGSEPPAFRPLTAKQNRAPYHA
jgi:DNA-binding response OmpR family regulator